MYRASECRVVRGDRVLLWRHLHAQVSGGLAPPKQAIVWLCDTCPFLCSPLFLRCALLWQAVPIVLLQPTRQSSCSDACVWSCFSWSVLRLGLCGVWCTCVLITGLWPFIPHRLVLEAMRPSIGTTACESGIAATHQVASVPIFHSCRLLPPPFLVPQPTSPLPHPSHCLR